MKKRLQLIVLALATTLAGFAQIDARYGVGAVPVVNNRVTFEKTLPIPDGLNEKWAYAKALKWVENRFVVPTVLSSKIVEQDETNYHLVIQAEEYLTFKRNWIVLDRTRINYLLEITPAEGGMKVRMTRIKYWYEEERDGGQRFTAEEWITDEQCLNASKTRLLRATGKFRIKTIDLFNQLTEELKKSL
jgi:hypothetical protein